LPRRIRCRNFRKSSRTCRRESPRRWCVFDIAAKEREIAELEKESAKPDFWLDQTKAQGVMRQLAEKKRAVQQWRELEKKASDLTEFSVLY
jgi:hypothetical protein